MESGMAVEDAQVLAYIGLGANLTNPEDQVRRALAELDQLPASHLRQASPLYLTAPLGPVAQPDYINAVAALETRLAPDALLAALQAIEDRHDRDRTGVRWGPRTLDLDLLLYGQAVVDAPGLRVPHPELARRAFVLVPLADLAPVDLVIPGMGCLGELLAACPREGLRPLRTPDSPLPAQRSPSQ